MFAVFSSESFWGACPRLGKSLGAGGRKTKNCECCTFALGGPMEAFAGLVESPASDTPDRTSLSGRLGQFCVCSASSTRNKIRNLRTGERSGLSVLPPLAGLASDGSTSIAVHVGDVNVDSDRNDVQDAREKIAWELLEFYSFNADLHDEELEDALCAGLSVLRGSCCFVLHDRKRHRVVAARTGDGVDLFWGMTPDASLLFSTTMDSAIDQCQFQVFPSDCLFVSTVADAYSVFVQNRCPGRLVPFAHSASPLPRGDRAQAAIGNVNMCRIASGTDLALITSKKGYMLRTPSVTEMMNASQMASAR